MKLTVRPRRRPAFTLVELLVVIAIIAILCALLAAGIMRMLAVSPHRNTELLIHKLTKSLEQQWQAVIDQAKSEEIPPAVWQEAMTQSGGDPDAALSLYVTWRLRQEFPTSFAGALNPPVPAAVAAYFPRLPVFDVLSTVPPPPPSRFGNDSESSICLYLAMTVARRGMEFDAGSLAPREARAVDNAPNNVKCFYDYWDEPLLFEWRSGRYRLRSPGGDHQFHPAGKGDDLSSDAIHGSRWAACP